MPFITQGKANIKYILIVAGLAILAIGGIFWCLSEEKDAGSFFLVDLPERIIEQPESKPKLFEENTFSQTAWVKGFLEKEEKKYVDLDYFEILSGKEGAIKSIEMDRCAMKLDLTENEKNEFIEKIQALSDDATVNEILEVAPDGCFPNYIGFILDDSPEVQTLEILEEAKIILCYAGSFYCDIPHDQETSPYNEISYLAFKECFGRHGNDLERIRFLVTLNEDNQIIKMLEMYEP